MDVAVVLMQDLHAHGSLPRDHIGVVIGVDERQTALFGDLRELD